MSNKFLRNIHAPVPGPFDVNTTFLKKKVRFSFSKGNRNEKIVFFLYSWTFYREKKIPL